MVSSHLNGALEQRRPRLGSRLSTCFRTAHLNSFATSAMEIPPQGQKLNQKPPLLPNHSVYRACLALEETHQDPYVTLIDVGTPRSRSWRHLPRCSPFSL